jgi:hypothetical protein
MSTSAARQFDSKTQFSEPCSKSLAMVALNLNIAILNGPARAAQPL